MVTCWGKNGTRTRVIENILKPDGSRISAQVDYEYDDLYRLVHEHRTAYNGGDPGVAYEYNFAYDDAGNRTSWQTVGGSTISYTYDAANKMTSPGTFTYDDKGNNECVCICVQSANDGSGSRRFVLASACMHIGVWMDAGQASGGMGWLFGWRMSRNRNVS